MKKEITIHGKLTAIGYLISNTKYTDEWSGADMYEAIEKVYKKNETTFEKSYLDRLLIEAEEK